MRVALAFLLVFCALIHNVSGGGKGFKSKGVNLKKKLVHKIFHHHHHHHYHHHHPHHPHHHHQYHHHQYHQHHHQHHLHHHNHHDGKNKHHNHHHHHHRHHHHHYHNPFKHHLHRHHHPHKKIFHRHHHKQSLHQHHRLHRQQQALHPHHRLHKQQQPLHQHHHAHKQHIQKHHKDVEHRHSNKRSGITHAPVQLPNTLQLHVQIKDSQATKRQSLPDLLANLGQHLVKLGSSMSPKKSQMAVHDNTDNEGEIRNEVPEPEASTVQSPTVQDSSVDIPTVSLKKNVSVNEVDGLLHHPLDAANGDEMESAFSGNGAKEASSAVVATSVNRTDEATTADRRNETFLESEIYGRPVDDREYDASERQRESANETLEQIAGQSFQTENTHQLDQPRNGHSNAGKEDKPAVHDRDQSKNVEPKTNVDDVDTNTVLEQEKIQENSTQNDSSKLKTQSSSEEAKSSDMNSTLEDEGREIEKDTSKSGADESQKSVPGESDAQGITDDEEKKTEVSGSGEEPSDDDNTEEQKATDNKESQGAKSTEQAPGKPNQDEQEYVAEQSIDQNKIGSAEGEREENVKEREGKPFINQTADSLDEPTKPASEGNMDEQAVVNVAGNQIMGNQSDDSFQPDSTEGADSKMGDTNLGNNKPINPPDSNAPEKTVSLDSPIKGSSIQDAKLRGDLDKLAIQHASSEPEKSVPASNLEKVLQTKNGGPTTQLDAITDDSNQSNEKDHLALNEIDKASGITNVGQESLQENEATQDQDSYTDIEGFAEGPKTPAVLDEPAEPSSPSNADPQVVNVESSQEGNLQEDTSQEAVPEDAADAIPVYTLSSPVGDDTFRGDESILSTPTSSVTTSSVNFIDAGGNMSTGYSELPSLSEGYGTFTAPVSQSQEEFDSLSQGAVVQRDMLDDPVKESLETTVDSKSS